MQTYGSVASVIAAIREEAAAEVERLEQTTATETARMRADAEKTTITIADRAERLAIARRRAITDIATAEWEGRRAVIEQREAWISAVVKRAEETWRPDRTSLLALAGEALEQLPALACSIAVARNDAILADAGFCADLARMTGKPAVTVAGPAPIAGGCIASCGDITFDNSIDARARRSESEWRAAISKLYTVTP